MAIDEYTFDHGGDGALVKHFVLDAEADIATVPTDNTVAVGSDAYCPSTGKRWILTPDGTWTELA